MKKLLLGTICLVLFVFVPGPVMARVDISIGISVPPLFVLNAPPVVVPMPDADNVYVVPDIDIDIFFWSGWWWMPWEGRWYRSHYYDRGWAYYNSVPVFYFDVDPGWRRYYREGNWYGHRWNYERIPYQRLQQNWRSWHNNRYWERRKTWGIENYRPRPQQQRQELRGQRQEQYRQRPEVRQHQQLRQSQVPRPGIQPQGKSQVQRPQRKQPQNQRPQGQQPRGIRDRRENRNPSR
jgi:hypothetical protein